MAKKLNSMRVLEQNDIQYEVYEYDPITRDAEEVAEMIGMPYFMVYKTLIVEAVDRPDIKKPYIALVSSDSSLDLKKLAAAVGVKKVKLASHDDAEAMTGLQVGGISPLALTAKQWPVYLDRSATEGQHIIISAGERGLQVKVPVTPVVNLLRARLAEIARQD
jgi:Cys-tRNA(Pro)/Cys-tRNA(Cys) deacylase